MSSFICPVCKKDLNKNNKIYCCENNHTYDIAKSGYVNLLMSQQIKSKRHGDDKLMVKSRCNFLNKGYYDMLLYEVIRLIKKYVKNNDKILDAGCGECFYTSNIYNDLLKNNIEVQISGIDISKDALSLGAKRGSKINLAVASVFCLPIKDKSFEMLLNIFAVYSGEEFERVLKNGGIMIRVIPLEKHLWGLKKLVYDLPYENTLENNNLDGFELLEIREIRKNIHLASNIDILNAFSMTPYYYKTSVKDQEKLININQLDTEIEFEILVYRKKQNTDKN